MWSTPANPRLRRNAESAPSAAHRKLTASVVKRLGLVLALVCACAALTACSTLEKLAAALPSASPAASGPNLSLIALNGYTDQEGGGTDASATGADYMAIDLWLDGTQNMGGVSAIESSMYPHAGKKYHEGGFHYHYGTRAGWYESLLRDFLVAAGDTRVRTLRYGNETFPNGALEAYGLTGTDAESTASLWRDLHTGALGTTAGFFSSMSAEDMTGSFYALGSPVWVNRIDGLDTQELENPSLSGAMSTALSAQIASIAAGDANYVLSAGRDGQNCAFYTALQNIDTEKLSVLTVDPASIRKVSGSDTGGKPVAWYEQALRNAGVFDKGLCVGVLDFTLDYMGQMSTVGSASLSEPLIWGRVILDEKKQTFVNLGVMPRHMLTFVIGSKTMVNGFIDSLSTAIDADRSLKGLRGPQSGELTYAANGETITQQPFTFAWNHTVIARPGMGLYTQHTEGAVLEADAANASASHTATATEGASGLPLLTLTPDAKGKQPDRTLTVRFPIAASADGAKLDVSKLSGASIEPISSLLLSDVLDNTPANAAAESNGAQTIAYRDKLYVFSTGKESSAFSITDITQESDELVCTVAASGAALKAGYYRLRLTADVTADQVAWENIPWIDESENASATITEADVYTWETFTAAITKFDRDAKGLPKMFQHAWGGYTEKLYHGLRVPDFPPVYKALHLQELTTQIRSAAASDTSPLIRYAFEVFVQNP